jgi:hypothetical protein
LTIGRLDITIPQGIISGSFEQAFTQRGVAMERMEHFRGKLLDGEQVVIDLVDGYLGCHAMESGRKTWFGYFELSAEQRAQVNSGVRYNLNVSDGRSCDLYFDIHPSNAPGKYTAEFQVTGQVKEKRTLLR